MPHIDARRTIRSAGAAAFVVSVTLAAPALAKSEHSRSTAASRSTPTATASTAGGSSPTGGVGLGGSPGNTRGALASTGDSQHLGDRVLKEGMSGHDVRVLQDFLTLAGFPTTVTGQFGSITKQSVIAFQRAHRLKADGVVTFSVSQALRAVVGKPMTPSAAPAGPVSKAHLNSDGTASAPANAPASIKAVIAAGNRIAFKPYIYGGGHGSWNDSGYDCSGSVSYALHGANLISSPEDSTELESYGSPGRGRWITIWANSGHTYMYVAGLRFDTSAQGDTGGSRWTSQPRSNDGFVERHPTGL